MIINPRLPQVSALSAVLFNVYTLNITRAGRTVSYADDIPVKTGDGRHSVFNKDYLNIITTGIRTNPLDSDENL